MCCIVAILKSLNIKFNNNLCIGTTSYVVEDKKSDLRYLINQISDEVPIIYTNLGLNKSKKNGLKAYSKGFVKEGAGAGGTTIAAYLKEKDIDQNIFINKLEENYYDTIEKPITLKNIKEKSKEGI
jgi:NaMN:DMB phosphoribosyltransferase